MFFHDFWKLWFLKKLEYHPEMHHGRDLYCELGQKMHISWILRLARIEWRKNELQIRNKNPFRGPKTIPCFQDESVKFQKFQKCTYFSNLLYVGFIVLNIEHLKYQEHVFFYHAFCLHKKMKFTKIIKILWSLLFFSHKFDIFQYFIFWNF